MSLLISNMDKTRLNHTMKNSKSSQAIFIAGILVLALLGYLYFGQVGVFGESSQSGNFETGQSLSDPEPEATKRTVDTEKPTEADVSLATSDKSPQEQSRKKPLKQYEEDWCMAQDELSESDMQRAITESQDWTEFVGKAGVKGVFSEHRGTYSEYENASQYPNNHFVAAYEALPEEELASLAKAGDKWAMVAYVQLVFVDSELQVEIAKKMLVQGTLYHALNRLVIHALVDAGESFKRSGASQETIEHLIDAVSYAYWGMEQYSEKGLTTFGAVTAMQEPFKSQLSVEAVLADYQQEIKANYQKLDEWVRAERAKADIEVPTAPIVAQREFALSVANQQRSFKSMMDFFSSLEITDSNPISRTPCVEQYHAIIMERLKHIPIEEY